MASVLNQPLFNGKVPVPASAQHGRFVEIARHLGWDEGEGALDEKLRAVVGPKLKANKDQDRK